jgi:FixJ family two-component response regulator
MSVAMNNNTVVFVVDDDHSVRKSIERLMRAAGFHVQAFSSAEEFLISAHPDQPSCLILDVCLPGSTGLELQKKLTEMKMDIPIIFISGHADVPISVEAMKRGAVDFLEKPYRTRNLLDAVKNAIEQNRKNREQSAEVQELQDRYNQMTPREREVMLLVVSGLLNKEVAEQLGTSEKTIKFHRHHVMTKMQARSLAELVRFAEKLSVEG